MSKYNRHTSTFQTYIIIYNISTDNDCHKLPQFQHSLDAAELSYHSRKQKTGPESCH